MEEQHKKRFNVLREFLDTERKFVLHMNEIVNVYKIPLENGSILRPERVSTIFSNVQDILNLNSSFLKVLEQIDGSDPLFAVGKAMRPIAPFFKMYNMYCSNHGHASEIIANYTSRSGHKFNKFLESASSRGGSGQSLQSLLIMPIQRLLKLKMILERLFKYTDSSHPDHDDLETCLKCIREVADHVNKGVTEKENRLKMWEVQQILTPSPTDLVQPHRSYVREGYLTKVCRRTNKRWYFFLFTDILIYGYKIVGGSRVQHKRTIELRRVNDLPARHNNGCAFVLFGKPKSFVVIASSPREKYEWLTDLSRCCHAMEIRREKQLALQKEGEFGEDGEAMTRATKHSDVGKIELEDDEAPLWVRSIVYKIPKQKSLQCIRRQVPDSFSTACMCCANKFNAFTNRRHHCRKCGILVCDTCSKGKLLIKTVDSKHPVRICDRCKIRHAEKEAEKRLSRISPEKRKRSESSFDGNYEKRVPLGSRPLPNIPSIKRPPPVAPKPSRQQRSSEDDAPLERSSSRLSESVRKAARNSSRNHLLRNSMKSIVDQKIESSSSSSDVHIVRKKKENKKNKKKKNSRQVRKTNKALEYLSRRSPERQSERKTLISKPSRPAPPPPNAMTDDDDSKHIDEKDYASRTSVQRRIDALNRLKLNGVGRRMPIPQRSLKKKGRPPTLPRRGKKMTPKLNAIVEKMGVGGV